MNTTDTMEPHSARSAAWRGRWSGGEAEARMSHVEIASQAQARWGWVRVGIEAVWRIEEKRGARLVLGSVRIVFVLGGSIYVFEARHTSQLQPLGLRVSTAVSAPSALPSRTALEAAIRGAARPAAGASQQPFCRNNWISRFTGRRG